MKMKTCRLPLLLASLALLSNLAPQSAHAGDGASSGGGGDIATERRIDDVRDDIRKWIGEGGADWLALPVGLDVKTYIKLMAPLLRPHAVVIGAVTTLQESLTTDPELKVSVDGQPKTCRGFVSDRDRLPHILCNVERFAATPRPDHYELVHHEYAGLAGIERNIGASSDYSISHQLTGALEERTEWKLVVKKIATIGRPVRCITSSVCEPLNILGDYRLLSENAYCDKDLRITEEGGAGGDEVIGLSDDRPRGTGLSIYGVRAVEFQTQQAQQVQGTRDPVKVDRIFHRQWIELSSSFVALVHRTEYAPIAPLHAQLFEGSRTAYDRVELRPTQEGLLQYLRYDSFGGKGNYKLRVNCLYKRR
jgi:hypothetical protein